MTLDLLISELVVNHANKSNRVTEGLERRNFGAPNDHGGHNKDDVLENTTECEDHGRSFANLQVMLVVACYPVKCETKLTNRTRETLSINAHSPLRKNVNSPTW